MPPRHQRARPASLRIVSVFIAAFAVLIAVTALVTLGPQSHASDTPTTVTSTTVTTLPDTSSTTSTSTSTTTTTIASTPADKLRLVQIGQYSSAEITPKSVDASGTGLVFAQNMVYRHTVSVFNARNGALIQTIPTTINL